MHNNAKHGKKDNIIIFIQWRLFYCCSYLSSCIRFLVEGRICWGLGCYVPPPLSIMKNCIKHSTMALVSRFNYEFLIHESSAIIGAEAKSCKCCPELVAVQRASISTHMDWRFDLRVCSYILANNFILDIPGCPLCNSHTTAPLPGLGTMTLGPQQQHRCCSKILEVNASISGSQWLFHLLSSHECHQLSLVCSIVSRALGCVSVIAGTTACGSLPRADIGISIVCRYWYLPSQISSWKLEICCKWAQSGWLQTIDRWKYGTPTSMVNIDKMVVSSVKLTILSMTCLQHYDTVTKCTITHFALNVHGSIWTACMTVLLSSDESPGRFTATSDHGAAAEIRIEHPDLVDFPS